MPLLELKSISKSYGDFQALDSISITIEPRQVTCILGDNGAGKSTLIKILSGLHEPTSGMMYVDDEETMFHSPSDALSRGIATVYQDLAVVGQMSVWRNFFLGQELTRRWGQLRVDEMKEITRTKLAEMGAKIPSVDAPISSLSGGQRQVVAIARAIHFGARLIILDEPTAALGVKQSGMVLRFIRQAQQQGVAIILITHNPHHAFLVGDQFVVLNMGTVALSAVRSEISIEELTTHMAGGTELALLEHEFLQENQET